ncbi:rhodanese-like domain-containing protein [Consotaella salsifontis]|uniref:Thiosulfate sulfurtransferase n=1 Tax=Consotaella salsifontis TaxID=1365950 RepID=A0A1T4RPW1_9HYPH|nr:rhodanese-like domain-containing protein [Consotaella salsifontis]SKA17982.1 thiosulfate sulfurtransferase [Consotaella salsifontis]
MTEKYKGDVTPKECWDALANDPSAVLVDVRTAAEWAFVGIPDLSSLGRQPILAEWQSYPSMAVDAAFADKLSDAVAALGADTETPLYFLCRSGARSVAGATAMTARGYSHCFNILEGFEGPLDGARHRGASGWKAAGLPWVQQ